MSTPTKRYGILAHYYTGDSFGSQDRDEELDLTWNKLEVAEENLNRIRDHYKYYRSLDEAPSKAKRAALEALCKVRSWFVPKYTSALILVTDDGKPWQFSAPWCGYFEGLYSAEVVVAKEHLPSFTV